MPIDTSALVGKWIHSREEDKGEERVFRPMSYKLPPARGRDAFELHSDQTWIDKAIAPGDGNLHRTGRWELAQGNELRLFHEGNEQPAQTMRIVSAVNDRLVVTDPL